MDKREKFLRQDPTKTTMLRRAAEADIRRRVNKLKKAIAQYILTLDAADVPQGQSDLLFSAAEVPQGQDILSSDSEKIDVFYAWLQDMADEIVFEKEKDDNFWFWLYVGKAYQKGYTRAYQRVRKEQDGTAYQLGGLDEFLRAATRNREMDKKIRMLYGALIFELRGFVAALVQLSARAFVSSRNYNLTPRKTIKLILAEIDKQTNIRAASTMRTEIVRAYAEGTLDALETLGIKHVGALVEFVTAGDDRVCPRCQALDGRVYTIEEARGIIPVHNNCRCAWFPIFEK